MSREQSNGWGATTSGVTYSAPDTIGMGVTRGSGFVDLRTPGRVRTVKMNLAPAGDVRTAVDVAVDSIPTSGNGIYSTIQLRAVAGSSYQATLRVLPQGRATVEMFRYDAGTKRKVSLGTAQQVPGTIRSGQTYRFEFETAGTSTVELRARAWPAGTASPQWQTSTTDSSSSRISVPGNTLVDSYLSASSQPTVVRYDNVLVQQLARVTPTNPAPPVAPVAPAPGYLPGWGNPTWADEFTGSTSKWNVRDQESLSYDRARILARNVTVSNGFLNITAKREDAGGRAFTTGYLDSNRKYEQRYGRWEIRAQIPTLPGQSRGIWPAFWLRNDTVGEIDVMEAWGDPFTNPTRIGTSTMTVHESTLGGGRKAAFNWEQLAGSTQHSALAFHTWAIEYTPTDLKGYFDGKLVVTLTKEKYPWLWGPNFTTPLEMRLNLQVGSPYHGYPIGPNYSDTKMPATFKIDYVRAWKLG